MVLHKRLDYGSSGYQVPPMPLVPRSARGKRSVRKKIDDKKQISAFDLLVTVAGELLSETENYPPPCKTSVGCCIKQEHQENEMSFKAEVFDQGSCNESTLGSSESIFKRQVDIRKCLEKNAGNLVVEDGSKTPIQGERRILEINHPIDLDAKPLPALVSSDSSVEVHISRNGSFSKCRDAMEIVDRDDENSSGGTHPGINVAKAFRPQRIGECRIRKLLASKFWKVPSTALMDGELSNIDVEMKPSCRSRKMCFTRQRTRWSLFKRRKLFERRSVSASARGIYGEANGASSSTTGSKSSYESGDYHVKFSIKSFKVPELFIEIPETATVGSLKKTVMEAVTAILEGGLRVGVLLQGKKVRDNKQTLLQAGISHNNRMENLGFTLEHNSTQVPPSLLCSEDSNSLLPPNPNPNVVLPCAPTEPVKRIEVPTPVIDQGIPEPAREPHQTSNLNGIESDHESVHSHTQASCVDKHLASSKALVPVPDMNADPLAVVPLCKSRRAELVQRRIRRPFSVTEVEALVQAVEKLGTGRWRDVKIGAFYNAKHRTYVDLKDKWKTLVHTARITPQQRRGEPVPQDLLDRVLSAHAYWSQQQAKLQAKPIQAEPCLLI